MIEAQTRDGQIAGDTADIAAQIVRPLGRDAVPDTQIGVADTLLRVLRQIQQVRRRPAHGLSVFVIQLTQRLLRALKEQVDDLRVLHVRHSLSVSPLQTQNRDESYINR